MRTHTRVYGRGTFRVPLAQKKENRGHFMSSRTKEQDIFSWSYPDGYRDKLATITCPPFGGNSFCFIAGMKTGSKKSIWTFK